MRVIAGSLRGMKLDSPQGINTRPTLDRVKEAVFSMLMPYINDAVVLDAFAGSGAIGIEAISRGADKAVFVDNSKEAVKCINTNILSARIQDKSIVENCDILKYLSHCKEKFDIIFLDPPYFEGIYSSVLKVLSEKELLNQNGLIIVEWDYETGFTDKLFEFEIFKKKKYGRVGICVLKRG